MSDYSQHEGKRVTLTLVPQEGEEVAPLEGKVEVVNALGILFKAKGRSGLELYENERIQSIEGAPEKPKQLKAKNLKLVEVAGAKQHLVDRHGYSLSDINAMADEDAFSFHESLDHSDLGHQHKAEAAASEESEGATEEAA